MYKEHPQYPLGMIQEAQADYVWRIPAECFVMVLEDGKKVWYNANPIAGGFGIRWRIRETRKQEELMEDDLHDFPDCASFRLKSFLKN